MCVCVSRDCGHNLIRTLLLIRWKSMWTIMRKIKIWEEQYMNKWESQLHACLWVCKFSFILLRGYTLKMELGQMKCIFPWCNSYKVMRGNKREEYHLMNRELNAIQPARACSCMFTIFKEWPYDEDLVHNSCGISLWVYLRGKRTDPGVHLHW